MRRAAVVGASGFVGSAVSAALRDRGVEVVPLRAPRVNSPGSVAEPAVSPSIDARTRSQLRLSLSTCDVVVNCAGLPDATGARTAPMIGANAELPGILADIASDLAIRLVHVSSAAVQGRRAILDASPETAPFSPYSWSKSAGERAVLSYSKAVVYRPPGVHGLERPVTAALARLARSPFSSVAGAGTSNSPQSLIENVADAVAFLATCTVEPPSLVHHPSEGLTVASLLEDLGGREPLHLPIPLARTMVYLAFVVAKVHPPLKGIARRLEILWFGQGQAASWLTEAGWTPPRDRTAWREIGRALALESTRKE